MGLLVGVDLMGETVGVVALLSWRNTINHKLHIGDLLSILKDNFMQ